MKSRRQMLQLARSNVVQEKQGRELQNSWIKPCPELVIQFFQLSWALRCYSRDLCAR